MKKLLVRSGDKMSKLTTLRIFSLVAIFGVVSIATLSAQTFTTIYIFSEGGGGYYPSALVQGFDGNLYGTTQFGGPVSNGNSGTAFKITPDGQLTTLYNFCSQTNCTDGAHPNGLVLAANGRFYGTTQLGGRDCRPNNGNGDLCGTVFEITPGGKLTTLYRFCSAAKCADGKVPQATLVQGANGNFYGTTSEGGPNCVYNGGCGTVFAITPEGKLTTLYGFCSEVGCSDGVEPLAPLLLATDGNFYGTTSQGGIGYYSVHYGTVFEITPAGKLTTVYTFCSVPICADGYDSTAGLVQGNDGTLYGTTSYGGSWAGDGTVFEVTTAGQFSTFYRFCPEGNPPCLDGRYPLVGLVQASDGNLYGTTQEGGTTNTCSVFGCGTIFEVNPETPGELTTLYSFCPETCEYAPQTPLVQATSGSLFGTTPYTVYEFSLGLEPFVEANPNVGEAGRIVNILGNNLEGTTEVEFNYTEAEFTVVSNTLIKATVPAGATTGTLEVDTPKNALKSSVAFQVLP